MNLKTSWVVLSLIAVGCSSAPPGKCLSNAECVAPEVCTSGACVPPPAQCEAGQTRPCGPEPVGACRKGTQQCVQGKFETACQGAITAAAETCNGVDDDCDGVVDNGAGTLWIIDADGDGVGSALAGAQTQTACVKPAGFTDSNTDCDDAAALTHPGAAEACTPAGLDENCNGTVDEGCGGCAPVGQTQPCCSSRGVQTCEANDGGTSLSACSVLPSGEVCNGVDDDCDGQVDEQVLLGNLDGGVLGLDGGATALSDGTCRAGTGVCLASGVTSCSAGALACSAAPGASQTEKCNTLDDDCDGQVDEAGAGLCPLTGQVCTAGSCGCPGGQSICNGVCVTLSAEVCDGLDNDCNGQIDEALTIACAADPDGDGYATSAITSQQCPNSARPQAGNCPAGYVAPAQSLGLDCQPSNAALYRLLSSRNDADGDASCVGTVTNDCVGTAALAGRRFAASCAAGDDCNDASATVYRLMASRADADNDTACVGAVTNDCVGTGALTGRRFATTCAAVDDCNDASAAAYRLVASRNDADNDGSCAGAVTNDCVGAAALIGRRFAASCPAGDDCNDTNAGVYRLMDSRADADADGYCAGASALDCVGGSALPNRRFTANCLAPDDCNDGNGSVFRLASVRTDSDNDGWCTGLASTQCIGSSPTGGLKLTANCQGDDCRDTNSQATSACTLTGAYYTNSHTQTCPNGAQTFTLNPVSFCPLGFTTAGTFTAQRTAGLGQCTANSETSITQTCNFLEGSTCRVVADCVALPIY